MSRNENDLLIDKFFKTVADRSRQADQHQAEIKKDSEQIAAHQKDIRNGMQNVTAAQVEIQREVRQTASSQADIQQNLQKTTKEQSETKKQIAAIADQQTRTTQAIGHINQAQGEINANSKKTLSNQENIQKKLSGLSDDLSDLKEIIPPINDCKSMLQKIASHPAFPDRRMKLASQWECSLFLIKANHNDQAIARQQQVIADSWPRPCGKWLPCFGLFEPKRTNAEKAIKKLTQEQNDNLDTYRKCLAHFGSE